MINLLQHRCDIERYTTTSNDAHGQPVKVYATAAEGVPCFWSENGGEQIDGGQGLVPCDATVFFGPDVTVKETDRLVRNGVRWNVVKVDAANTPAGVHHYEVGVKRIKEADE